jgi:adenosylcobyric acid synthase
MAKAIMIQGTTSNAGKSLITAGLCRIFKQDGYKVAPFKAQNMALNSYITKEGLEMGRAQVVQAEAAGIEPSVLMNPVLLKPTNDTSSQVIVNGEVVKNMSAREYHFKKREIVPKVMEAYNELASNHDIIVIEGAGSPAEINLKDTDIVNMFMAKQAKAPVLIAGDIDRGGVFASLAGTMLLFDESERKMVKGVLINKFRGDKSILQPGLDMLEDIIKVPTVGVIPYLHIDIEDEDSLTERFNRKGTQGQIDIAVIRLPRISNFTDFNVLEYMPEISLRYVKSADELQNPDLIIIPGTKNTMISSLDSTTLTKPTGTPIISSGLSLPSLISSYSLTKAVGALPIAKIRGPVSPAALSMLAVALVVPFALASSATSSSEIKHTAFPPSSSKILLLTPDQAILVSVTIVAPFFKASRLLDTAPSENFRLLI